MPTESKKWTPLSREDLAIMEAKTDVYPRGVVETVRKAIEKRERKNATRPKNFSA